LATQQQVAGLLIALIALGCAFALGFYLGNKRGHKRGVSQGYRRGQHDARAATLRQDETTVELPVYTSSASLPAVGPLHEARVTKVGPEGWQTNPAIRTLEITLVPGGEVVAANTEETRNLLLRALASPGVLRFSTSGGTIYPRAFRPQS
jgi:hypothetical protein